MEIDESCLSVAPSLLSPNLVPRLTFSSLFFLSPSIVTVTVTLTLALAFRRCLDF